VPCLTLRLFSISNEVVVQLMQVPPELHRELFLSAKKQAELNPDFFKSLLGGGDLKGAASAFFSKMTG
jgi:hypothetical protein